MPYCRAHCCQLDAHDSKRNICNGYLEGLNKGANWFAFIAKEGQIHLEFVGGKKRKKRKIKLKNSLKSEVTSPGGGLEVPRMLEISEPLNK